MEQNIDRKALIRAAFAAREYAYTPYSNFKVGAALLAKNGSVYTGCNIECASFTPTNCAERTALFKAVSEGVHEFAAVAVVGAKDSAPDDALVTSPCGVCRQMLSEFGGPDLRVLMAKSGACCGPFEAFAQRRCKKIVICAMPGGLEKHTGILYTGQGNP